MLIYSLEAAFEKLLMQANYSIRHLSESHEKRHPHEGYA